MKLTTRRNFLWGMGAGTSLLLPMWKTMIPEALGQESQRKRIFFYAGAIAASAEHFPTRAPGSDDLVVTDSFRPLAPYRDEMLFLEELNCPWDRQQHGPDWFLTGTDGRPGGITLDRYIGREIGSGDPRRSLQLAMYGCNAENMSASADGPGQVFPSETNPVRAYADIFGSGVLPEDDRIAAAEEMLSRRKSLLDFVRDDIHHMQLRLAGPERAKMDQYLTSLRDLEEELTNLVNAQSNSSEACRNPEAPPGNLPGSAYTRADDRLIAAHLDVAINALICGMTSVALIHKNCSANYPFLGDSYIGTHDMWHESTFQQRATYYQYHAANMARVRERLGEVSEGNGTMADQSLIVYFERSGIHHHDGQAHSFLMTIGRAGGYFRTGRRLSFRGRNLNDGFVSIANAMGIATNTFGDSRLVQGPLPGLTA